MNITILKENRLLSLDIDAKILKKAWLYIHKCKIIIDEMHLLEMHLLEMHLYELTCLNCVCLAWLIWIDSLELIT